MPKFFECEVEIGESEWKMTLLAENEADAVKKLQKKGFRVITVKQI